MHPEDHRHRFNICPKCPHQLPTSRSWSTRRTSGFSAARASGAGISPLRNQTTRSSLKPSGAARCRPRASGLPDIDPECARHDDSDQVFPIPAACLLQARLGIAGPPAIQVEAACTGFIYALSIAGGVHSSERAGCAHVIGAECLSRLVDWTDRGTLRSCLETARALVNSWGLQRNPRSSPRGRRETASTWICFSICPTGPSRTHNPAVRIGRRPST